MTANAINRYILQNKIGHASIQTDYVIPEVTGGTATPVMVVRHGSSSRNC